MKTRAKLQRNKMLYELFFDYEILHLQLKMIARFVLYLFRFCACCGHSDSNSKSRRRKPSPWLCEVHVKDEINDDQSSDAEWFLKKFYKKIRDAITEDDIQSLIITERAYQKYHRKMTKIKDEDDADED